MEIIVVDGDRRFTGTCNPVINHKIMIKTSPKCSGFVSVKKYKTTEGVFAAADRLRKKLETPRR